MLQEAARTSMRPRTRRLRASQSTPFRQRRPQCPSHCSFRNRGPEGSVRAAGSFRRVADVDRPLCACIGATDRQGDGLYPPGLRWLRPRCAGLPCVPWRLQAPGRSPGTGQSAGTVLCPGSLRRSGVAPQNSLRGLRPLRSDICGESEVEARCARRPRPCASRRRRFAPAGTARRLALAPVVFAAQATVAALAAGGTRQGRSVGRREAQRSGGSPARSAGPARRIYAAARQRRRGATAAAPRSEHRRAVPRSGTAPV